MKFTIDGYIYLLTLLKEKEYKITNYSNWERYDKCVILRHDVDFDMSKALLIAQTEYDYGVESVFFVLLTSNFYNIHSSVNKRMIKQIQKMGHTIGLHFDEMAYPEDVGNADRITDRIKKEIDILSEALETDVMVYSYHRPTKTILDSDIRISGVINSYERLFFKEFKYLSDSRMHWREPVLDIINQGNFSRMQILTHPFWYRDKEKSMKAILREFLNMADMQRYDDLNDNFTGLDKILDRGGMRL